MCVGDAQDAQDDAVCASASGRNFFFCDVHVLQNYLPEFHQNGWIFMQDNAPIHTYGPVKQ